ncbi:hypothetical protein [Microtetraspora malaysiensis]|uniref:hypothetical protein n=1 Tax=Microtetraspora malaysiensis TaxID=161358 RepID=UPI0008378818|nr:hypothetical protein [Microtetraspora malaysiensis]
MPRRSFLPLAVLTLLAGCGTGTTASPSAAPSPAQDKAHAFQAVKADCMKTKGFRYVPYVGRPKLSEEDIQPFDYATEKADRSKNGLGVFITYIHPDKTPDQRDNPNDAISTNLSPAQLGAYKKALESCDVQAVRQVTGKNVTSWSDWASQSGEMAQQLWKREIDGDPKLVELASTMGDCLTGKGYRVTSTNPVAMGGWALRTVMGDLRENRETITSDGDSQVFTPITLSPDEARPRLNKEIKLALDDLECGKRFYPAFLPKSRELEQRIDEEFGII